MTIRSSQRFIVICTFAGGLLGIFPHCPIILTSCILLIICVRFHPVGWNCLHPRRNSIPRMPTISHHKLLSDIITEGIEAGEFRGDLDADNVATILVGTIGGLSNLLVTTGMRLDWDKIKSSLVSTVRDGIMR